MAVTGVVDGCHLCMLPPKVHDGTRTMQCRICSVTYRNNKLRGSCRGPLKCNS